MDIYRSYIHKSRYAKYLPEEGRRETWAETVARYFDFFEQHLLDDRSYVVPKGLRANIEQAVLNMEIMPSMRCLMTAGPALARDHVAGYNCSFLPVSGQGKEITLHHHQLDEPMVVHLSEPVDFDEAMYVLMCGTGVGFSVERQFINNLPKVGKRMNRSLYTRNDTAYPGVEKYELSTMDRRNNIINVADSKYGWASALRILIVELYNGNFDITWSLSKLRPAGARLATFGGRSSGPEPLNRLFIFTKEIFKKANGRKLTSIECHDIMCKIGEVVVVGGVRRSALISLSNLTDARMRTAKSGDWWETVGHRALANNSVAYTEKPDMGAFMEEWSSLYRSGSGERGIFNREASKKIASLNGRRDPDHEFGTNPCSEIILRPYQFCNLTEVVVRAEDTLADLKRKTKYATILGTWQSTLVDFKYLRSIWQKNTAEERLLGVSMTGIMDNRNIVFGEVVSEDFYGGKALSLGQTLELLKGIAVDTNRVCAETLKIPQSAAITCVKPSGTVSQLVDSASGIHTRHSEYYIRRVRSDKKDPITQFMIDCGVPCEPDSTNSETMVFSFPTKAPAGALTNKDVGAMDMLGMWKTYQQHWCEHKPSITVYPRDHEWMEVGAWVYENFDDVSGISFLPFSEHTYQQAPYEEIDKDTYTRLSEAMPKEIDWDDFKEIMDNTTGTQELACVAGQCEI